MSDDLAKRLAAYEALMDAIVPESAYWLLGEREDADRVQFLAEAVRDPSTVPDRPENATGSSPAPSERMAP
ncbi:hypothetical protein BJF79_23625 [Actinomadura sp. CNU-125]|uniref:hypothetical protein n=1 Tax=Actinomadura sp. CNU-125 TaxID=1904961 RepID=UPI0009649A09|nr:hypothetical protein [Actinomadura sp. CNU-125]OLT11715.1 hypothetical protein BJF79_23625 [Actinomadura sp. CNU-125]